MKIASRGNDDRALNLERDEFISLICVTKSN